MDELMERKRYIYIYIHIYIECVCEKIKLNFIKTVMKV